MGVGKARGKQIKGGHKVWCKQLRHTQIQYRNTHEQLKW